MAVLFLNSGIFVSLPLEIRIKIYEHLKQNGGHITEQDLDRIYRTSAGNNPYGWNKNAVLIVEQEYQNAENGTSFNEMELQEQQKQKTERDGVLGILTASAVESVLFGKVVSSCAIPIEHRA